MSRKRRLLEQESLDPFAITDDDDTTSASSNPDSSFLTTDNALYGAIESADANRQSAVPVSIFAIHADPAQPRRSVPYAVRDAVQWRGDPSHIPDIFDTWSQFVTAERGYPFDMRAHLEERAYPDIDKTIEGPDISESHPGPLETTLLKLIELAVSIYREGLTNPITVVSQGIDAYRLETGERRWLAYHLLHREFGDEKYASIAARNVPEASIWRQAAENNARANLNAISRARQLAVLIMDLRQNRMDDNFISFEEWEREQQYYAQVADGDQYRLPRGTSEQLLNAMGLSHRKQIREYRALLRLPGIVWQIADDLNWTEYALRTLRQQAGDDRAKLISLAARKAREEGYTVPTGTLTDAPEPLQTATIPDRATSDIPPAPGTRQHLTQLTRLLRKAGPGKSDETQAALDSLHELKHWIDEQERLLEKYLKGRSQ